MRNIARPRLNQRMFSTQRTLSPVTIEIISKRTIYKRTNGIINFRNTKRLILRGIFIPTGKLRNIKIELQILIGINNINSKITDTINNGNLSIYVINLELCRRLITKQLTGNSNSTFRDQYFIVTKTNHSKMITRNSAKRRRIRKNNIFSIVIGRHRPITRHRINTLIICEGRNSKRRNT